MSDELRRALLATRVPHEVEAQRRAWAVVRAAHAEREPVARPVGRRLRPLLVAAALAAVLAATVSPVGGWVGDRLRGAENAEPALFRLPTSGQLLVVSDRGPWIVRPDGAKRLLGRYDDASFSPRGRFVVVTRGRRVTAVEPDGDPRWSLTRPEPVADARWAPSGFRVAYRAGSTLRVVVGDGTGDRRLTANAAPVAPVWQPDASRNVLAYADESGRVHVVDVDSGEQLERSRPGPAVVKLLWPPGRDEPLTVRGGGVLDVAFSADGRARASTLYDPEADRTNVLVSTCREGACREARRVFTGAGQLSGLAWSPDGRWLLVSWPDADQLLFLRMPGVRELVAASDIRREFDPGGAGRGGFPRVAGWIPELGPG